MNCNSCVKQCCNAYSDCPEFYDPNKYDFSFTTCFKLTTNKSDEEQYGNYDGSFSYVALICIIVGSVLALSIVIVLLYCFCFNKKTKET